MKRFVSLFVLVVSTEVCAAAANEGDSLLSRSEAIDVARTYLRSQNCKPERFTYIVPAHLFALDSLERVSLYAAFNSRRLGEVKRNLHSPWFWRVTAIGNMENDGIFEILIDAKSGKWFYASLVG